MELVKASESDALYDRIRGLSGREKVISVKEFYASGSNAQTTGSISNGSPTLTVADASTFAISQGVFVEGAGTQGSGNDLVATIINKAGSTLTLSANASATVSGAVVRHDDTRAINEAFNFILTDAEYRSGTVMFPDGVYNCNKGFDQTLTDARDATPAYPPFYTAYDADAGRPINSILYLPFINHLSPMRYIHIEGENCTKGVPGNLPEYGVIIQTILTGSTPDNNNITQSFFKTRSSVGTASDYITGFSRVKLLMSKINFKMPENSYLYGVNAANALNAMIKDVTVNTNQHTLLITSAANPSTGFYMPKINNWAKTWLFGTHAEGMNRGYVLSEHNYMQDIYTWRCAIGLDFEGGGHKNVGERISLEWNKLPMRFQGRSNVILDVSIEEKESGSWDSTEASDPHISSYSIPFANLDPDRVHGHINYSYSVQGGTPYEPTRKIRTDYTDEDFLKLLNNCYPNQAQVHGEG